MSSGKATPKVTSQSVPGYAHVDKDMRAILRASMTPMLARNFRSRAFAAQPSNLAPRLEIDLIDSEAEAWGLPKVVKMNGL